MESLIVVVDVLSAFFIVGLVLIQQGKGADMGASFGSGASQTLFGSAGTGNVLSRSTTWLAVIFMVASLSLSVLARNRSDSVVQAESLLANPAAVVNVPAPKVELPDLAAKDSSAADGAEVPSDDSVQAASATVAVDKPGVEAAQQAAPEAQAEQSTTKTNN